MLNTIAKRSLAAVATTLVLSGSALGGAAVATAQVNDAPVAASDLTNVTESSVNSIVDSTKDSSFTIHKYLGDVTGEAQRNIEKAPAQENLQPREGATFEVYKIDGLSPQKFDDWKTYSNINVKTVNKNAAATAGGDEGLTLTSGDRTLNLSHVEDVKTGADGTAQLSNPEHAFYYVVEHKDEGYSAVAPFLMSLPSPTIDPDNADNEDWNYDVHVYPKNQEITELTKTVDDSDDDNILDYTVRATIPQIPTNQDGLTRFTITDRQSATTNTVAKMMPETTKIAITVTPKAGKDATTIANGLGGTVSTDDSGNTIVTFDNNSGFFNVRDSANHDSDKVVELTKDGLAKVNKALPDANLDIAYTYSAEVSKIADEEVANGGKEASVQKNTVYLFPGNEINPEFAGNPDEPSEENDPHDDTESHFGEINLTKVDGDNNAITNSPATFELYRCIAANGSENGTAGSIATGSAPIAIPNADGKLETTFSTDDAGKLNISNIRLDNFQNGQEADADFNYCLVEIDAPEGFAKRPNPFIVHVNTTTPAPEINFENVNDEEIITGLPRTGQAGIIALVAAGLLAAAGAIFVTARKKEEV